MNISVYFKVRHEVKCLCVLAVIPRVYLLFSFSFMKNKILRVFANI